MNPFDAKRLPGSVMLGRCGYTGAVNELLAVAAVVAAVLDRSQRRAYAYRHIYPVAALNDRRRPTVCADTRTPPRCRNLHPP